MAEITPIMPSPTITGVSKVRRDEAGKNRAQQQPQPHKDKADQPEADEQPSQHIDEIV